MTFVPVMWGVWGLLAVITAALFVYRSRLQRDEDDQIYLDEAFASEKASQEAIIAQVNKIEPALHACMWTVAAASVFVVGYYILDAINKFR
jgi:hypothetical protein